MLTNEQKQKLKLIKDLSRVLADFAIVIEEDGEPATGVQDAIKAVDYYQRKLKENNS